ncbi:hypothetical protein H0H93_011097 [Arthromyces matolae]|nr:hypothetical protein H0H93_011097 [Arthromyces matolae]
MSSVDFKFAFPALILGRQILATSSIPQLLQGNQQLSSALTSYSHLQEGIYLFKNGVNPYSGGVFRHSPLYLSLFTTILPVTGPASTTLWTFCDAVGAWALVKICNYRQRLPSSQRDTLVAAMPSLPVLADLRAPGSPVLVLYNNPRAPAPPAFTGSSLSAGVAKAVIISWCQFPSNDITPLRVHLLCWSLHIIIHIYIRMYGRLSARMDELTGFRYDPLYAAFLLIGVLGTFKAYPTLSDPGLFLSMIALFPETYPYLRHPIVTALLHLHAALLMPLFNHLWLNQGTGNANFYYASTLVFACSNGAALLDCIWAGLRIAVGEEKEGYHVVQE